jgi:hypothetical protein
VPATDEGAAMAVRTRDLLGRRLTDLRYEPTGEPVGFAIPDVTPLPVPDPRIPFDVHTTDGERVEFRAAGGSRSLSGFRPEGPALAGFVVRDFDGADRWLEEDEEVAGHPRTRSTGSTSARAPGASSCPSTGGCWPTRPTPAGLRDAAAGAVPRPARGRDRRPAAEHDADVVPTRGGRPTGRWRSATASSPTWSGATPTPDRRHGAPGSPGLLRRAARRRGRRCAERAPDHPLVLAHPCTRVAAVG